MKRIVTMLLVVCMCLSISVMLTACGHEHTYQVEWSKDTTHHWHACEGEDCTDVADKAEHTWNDGEISTPATAEADGVKTFTCTICGQTKTESVQLKTTVTEEEWESAFAINNFTLDLNVHFNGENVGTNQHILYTPSVIHAKTTDSSGSKTYIEESFFKKTEDAKYDHYYGSNTRAWKHELLTDYFSFGEDNLTALAFFVGIKDMFSSSVYDESIYAYTLGEVSLYVPGDDEYINFTDAQVYFENGKIVKTVYNIRSEESIVEYIIDVSNIGNTDTIIIPKIIFADIEKEYILELVFETLNVENGYIQTCTGILSSEGFKNALEEELDDSIDNPEKPNPSEEFYSMEWYLEVRKIWEQICAQETVEGVVDVYNSEFKTFVEDNADFVGEFVAR